MLFSQSDQTIHTTLNQSQNIFRQIGETFFNARSLLVLAITLIVAIAAGRFVAYLLRRVTNMLGRQADKTENLTEVNRLRRFETLIVLSIAIIRTAFFALAIYFWWTFIHPEQQPTALVGASAVFAIVIGGVLGPLLRDLAYGSVMMAEHWFGVGDHVRIDPFDNVQGIVERVTLRSTRIRGINGEVIWINNQNIQAVRITPKGLRTIALELFVSDLDAGTQLIEAANQSLPQGPLMVASPLTPMVTTKAGAKLWHITAIGETAPGREWLLEKYAITVIQEVDAAMDTSVLIHEPIARYADGEAEKRFARSIQNARKKTIKRTIHKRAKRITKK
ncbi:MAG: mechanosensitive ion channel family protein [Candidatus Saccharimonadales bacterium]